MIDWSWWTGDAMSDWLHWYEWRGRNNALGWNVIVFVDSDGTAHIAYDWALSLRMRRLREPWWPSLAIH
jgi:hypothetical protein